MQWLTGFSAVLGKVTKSFRKVESKSKEQHETITYFVLWKIFFMRDVKKLQNNELQFITNTIPFAKTKKVQS